MTDLHEVSVEESRHRSPQQIAFELGSRVLYRVDTRRRVRFETVMTETLDRLNMEPDVYFIQIGTYDGIHDDPIQQYARLPHWHGIMVEPQPEPVVHLKRRYDHRPDIKIIESAISDDGNPITIWRNNQISSDGERAKASSDPKLTRRSLMRSYGPDYFLRTGLSRINATSITVESLLKESDLPRIDLFVTDTEGEDTAIVNCLLDQLKPSVILYEHLHSTSKSQRYLKKRLENLGYKTLSSHKDTLAVVQ